MGVSRPRLCVCRCLEKALLLVGVGGVDDDDDGLCDDVGFNLVNATQGQSNKQNLKWRERRKSDKPRRAAETGIGSGGGTQFTSPVPASSSILYIM